MAVTLTELARRFHGRVKGNPDRVIQRVASLETAGPEDIAYLSDKKYLPILASTAAGAVILSESDAPKFAGSALIVADPHLCFARIAQWLHPIPAFRFGRHPTAVISSDSRIAAKTWVGPYSVIEDGVEIGDDAYIGPGCFIGSHAFIGARSRLVGHVFIGDRCTVGEECIIHPGAVIGSDGFGFARDGELWQKVPQLGRVIIGNNVEVGASTTIDRGALNDTIIGNGVKMDNQIQIAHNVHIGDNTAIAAFVGIAGSTSVGKRCTLGGQAGITGHLEITDDVHITAGSLVTSSIKQAGAYSSSLKAEPAEKWRRNAARLHHLDEVVRRLGQVEEKLQQNSEEEEN